MTTVNSLKLLAVVVMAVAGLGLIACATTGKRVPRTTAEYAKTSVSITLANMRSGGSGVILRSTPISSLVLTNKHVCQLIQNGGVVNNDQGSYPVASFRVYKKHDLCLIQVMTDLHNNVKLAERPPELFDDIIVTGHPALLPTMVTRGHFSKHMNISLIVGVKDCEGNEEGDDAAYCAFMGKKPLVASFDAQSTSALIMPGSSGSGVFNSKGELSGLVFAGPGEGIGFGFIVPYEYVVDFLTHVHQYKLQRPDQNAKPTDFFTTLLKMENTCTSFGRACSFESSGLWLE